MATDKPIIAIDPGSTESAYIVITPKGIDQFGKLKNEDLLELFFKFSQSVKYDGSLLGIEMIASYGMPVGKEVFNTVFWIGRFYQEWAQYYLNAEALLIYRKDVKIYLCNSVKAKDGNIRQALIDKYGAPGTKKNPGFTYGVSKDVWSALAIASYMEHLL